MKTAPLLDCGMMPRSPKRERPVGEGRANNDTSVQKEAVLGGDPDPPVIVIVLRQLPWCASAAAIRGLSGPAVKGVPHGAPLAARCVAGTVSKSPAPATALRGLPIAALSGVCPGAPLAAVPEAGGEGQPPAAVHSPAARPCGVSPFSRPFRRCCDGGAAAPTRCPP